jgi:NtrC-family two-component system response regulator AlgB
VILGSGNEVKSSDLPGNILPAPSVPVIGDRVPLAVVEELHIRRIMASAATLQEAADLLGIDQATLWRRRKTYGI